MKKLSSAVLWFCIVVTGIAAPRPPLPPLPEDVMLSLRFDCTNCWDPGPTLANNTQLVDSWSGYAISLRSGGFAEWVSRISEQRIINPLHGAIRFWYAPTWTSGSRNGSEAALAELLAGDDLSPFLSLRVSPDGSALDVVSGSNPDLRAAIQWTAGTWHQVAVAYTTNGAALFIDGDLANSWGLLDSPLTPRQRIQQSIQLVRSQVITGFRLGTADGDFDEVATFNYPVTTEDIAWNYRVYQPIALLGPITAAEEAAIEQARELARERRTAMEASGLASSMLSGPSSPQPLDGPLDLSGPLRLTNLVFIATNNVQVTLAGGDAGAQYDIFRTRTLGATAQWAWLARGYQGDRFAFTNEPSDSAFYLAASTQDSDGDGLTDAYENLVAKTNPNQAPTLVILSPTHNSVLSSPTNLAITVVATNYISPVTVTIYANGIPVGTQASYWPSFSFGWTEIPVGDYAFSAVLLDSASQMATSAVVNVTVTLPELTALKCWLKPETLTSTATVTNWPDSSGNSNAALITNPTHAPRLVTNQLSGFPGVKFETTNNSYLAIPNFLGSATQAEAFVVLKPGAGALWTFSPDQEGTFYGTSSVFDAFGRTSAITFTDPALAGFHILNVSARPGESIYRINGRTVYADAGTTVNFGQGAWQYLGYNNRSLGYGTPTIVEVLLYTNVLAEVERITAGRYLNSKYKLLTNTVPVPTLQCQGPDPRTIVVTWNVVSNATAYILSRNGQTLTNTDTRTTSFVDSVISSQAITYTLTACGYTGTTNTSLDTPFMNFTSPGAESTSLVGSVVPISFASDGIPGFGGFTPARIDTFINGNAVSSLSSSPWSLSLSSSTPDRWNITAKVYDAAGNTRFLPGRGINIIADIDSDGDGVPDGLDAYPYDPTRFTAPGLNPNDHTPPTIILTEP